MKNKFLIGVVTFLVTVILLIIFLNLFDSNSKKTFEFERKFNAKNQIIKFDKRFDKMNTDEYIMSVNSDKYIVERDFSSFEKSEKYKFYYADYNFNHFFKDSLNVPIGSNILFVNENILFYSNKFKLFLFDKKTLIKSDFLINNFKVSSMKLLSKDFVLCFGELFIEGKYKTGFYKLNLSSKSVKLIKILCVEDKSNLAENSLKYSGLYTYFESEKIFSFCCTKFSEIYFFDNDGEYLKTLKTLDKTPLPKLIKNKAGFTFYERGSAWNTNMNLFVKDNKIFVFSTCNKSLNKIIIDEYSFVNSKYIQSFSVDYDNQTSFNVRNVYQGKNRIIISFETHYASFIFSRHI